MFVLCPNFQPLNTVEHQLTSLRYLYPHMILVRKTHWDNSYLVNFYKNKHSAFTISVFLKVCRRWTLVPDLPDWPLNYRWFAIALPIYLFYLVFRMTFFDILTFTYEFVNHFPLHSPRVCAAVIIYNDPL